MVEGLERLKYYTTSTPTGMSIDVQEVGVDLVTVCKAGGYTKKQFLEDLAKTWDETEVHVSIPNRSKN